MPVDVPPLPESVWQVATADGLPVLDDAAGELAALHAQTLDSFADDGWQHREDEMRRRRLVYSELTGRGLLRVVDDQSLGRQMIADLLGLNRLDEFVVGFQPNATFLSPREMERRRERKRIEARVEKEEEAAAAVQLAQASGGPPHAESETADPHALPDRAPASHEASSDHWPDGEDEAAMDSDETVDDEAGLATGSDSSAEHDRRDLLLGAGVDVGIPLTTEADSKGVMVRLPALLGTKYERRAVERLHELGWTILHVRGPIDVRPPNDMARFEAQSRRSARARVRFDASEDKIDLNEHSLRWDPHSGDVELLPDAAAYEEIAGAVRDEIPMPPTGLEAQPGDSPHTVAARIAAAADAQLAETALAAEAALDALLELHPHLRGRPVVVIGFSAGAISAPAVAVRLGDRVDAVVLIGGGADALTVSQTSSITRGGVKLAPPDGPEPSPEFVEQVRAAYRQLAQLDPYNSAPRLGHVPVLQVMARGDEMVPTEHQWTLWERLGRPDRLTWHGPLGHKGLFYFLSGQMGRIDRWVMREIEERGEFQKGRNAERTE